MVFLLVGKVILVQQGAGFCRHALGRQLGYALDRFFRQVEVPVLQRAELQSVGQDMRSVLEENMNTNKSFFERNGGTYRQVGDYLLPNLTIDESEHQPIGKYGRLRKRYLKKYRPVLYTNLLTTGKLNQHLAEIDEACERRMELLISQMARQEGVTEELKAADQMEWVRRMNSIRSRAEETVLSELVYC